MLPSRLGDEAGQARVCQFWGFDLSGFGFRVPGLGFRVWGLEFRVPGLGFRVWDLRSGLWGWGLGFDFVVLTFWDLRPSTRQFLKRW